MNRCVRYVSTFRQNEVPKPRRHFDNLVHRVVGQEPTVREIQDAKGLVCLVSWKLEEGLVGEQVTVCKAEFPEVLEVVEKVSHRRIRNLMTSV